MIETASLIWILVPTVAVEPVNSNLIRIIEERAPSSTITPVARWFLTTLQVYGTSKKDSYAVFLSGCIRNCHASYRRNRKAAFLNRLAQFNYQICERSMVIDCAAALNLELTVNLSPWNNKKPSLAS
ncbi:MAG: hypothetical protein J3Q66DRAFT_372685 [Benniella sp.]|nr:MAG: hypothetical protein J3Q66DRAFT_372685 [Benniella sp.]